MKRIISGLFLIAGCVWAGLSLAYLGFEQVQGLAEALSEIRPGEGYSYGGLRVMGWAMAALAALHVRLAIVRFRPLKIFVTLLAMALGMFAINTLMAAAGIGAERPTVLLVQLGAAIMTGAAVTVEWWTEFLRPTAATHRRESNGKPG